MSEHASGITWTVMPSNCVTFHVSSFFFEIEKCTEKTHFLLRLTDLYINSLLSLIGELYDHHWELTCASPINLNACNLSKKTLNDFVAKTFPFSTINGTRME